MNKKILWTVVIVLILVTGFITYQKLSTPTPVIAPAENQESASNTTPNPNTPPAPETIVFKCDDNKSFGVQFVAPTQAHLTLDNGEELLLIQSTSSPHLYEKGNLSFYVEGDEASLQLSGEKYDNCTVSK